MSLSNAKNTERKRTCKCIVIYSYFIMQEYYEEIKKIFPPKMRGKKVFDTIFLERVNITGNVFSTDFYRKKPFSSMVNYELHL